jgi:hypothetical protein
MFVDLLRTLFDSTSRSGKRNGRPVRRSRAVRLRPRLELLETREVPSTVNWIGGSGDWNDATHWLDAMTGTNHVPTASDDVVIAVNGITVTHGSTGSADQAHSLSWTSATDSFECSRGTLTVLSGPTAVQIGTLTLSGGTLDVAGTLSASTVTLSGGKLAHATVENGTTIVATSNPNNLLNGVTLEGNLDLMTNNDAQVSLSKNLMLPGGIISVGKDDGSTAGTLNFTDAETIDGDAGMPGTIRLGGSPNNRLSLYDPSSFPGFTVTLGAHLKVDGKSGTLTPFFSYPSSRIVNQGYIAANIPAGTITVNFGSGAGAGNSGTLVAAGGSLTVSGTWTNSGTLVAAGGSLTVNGTWTNSGTIRSLNGGTLSASTPTNYSSGTLTDGTWQVFDGSTLRVAMSTGIVTNAATILLDGANSNFYSNSGTTNAFSGFTTNTNSLTVQNGSTFIQAGTLSNTGLLRVGPRSRFIVNGNYSESGSLIVTGFMGVNGSYSQSGSPSLIVTGSMGVTGSYSQSGSLIVTGTMVLTGAFTNFSGGTLTGGTYQISGSFGFPNAAIATNAATIVLDGSGAAHIFDSLTGNDALAGLAVNAGSFTIQHGSGFTSTGAFTNNGTVTIADGSTVYGSGFTSTGAFTNNGTVTIADAFSGSAFASTGVFTNNGTVTIADGSTLYGGGFASTGAFTNNGTVTIAGGSAFIAWSSYMQAVPGTTTVQSGSTLILNGGGTADGAVSNSGTVAIAPGTTYTVTGRYSQSGILSVPAAATLRLTGTFTNFASNALTGGNYFVEGTFQFLNANIVTNAAALSLVGPGQIIDQNSNNGLANLATNTAAGLILLSGASLTTSGAFSNARVVSIDAGSTFTVTGDYTQTGGATFFSGGTLTASGLVDLQGGGLGGSGTINANVNNNARVFLGSSAAASLLTINGNYTQRTNGVLDIEIGGTNPGTGFDQLVINGRATLDGTLNVSLINGFVPTSGTAFQILTFGSASGTFATTNIDPSLRGPIYDPMDVTVMA